MIGDSGVGVGGVCDGGVLPVLCFDCQPTVGLLGRHSPLLVSTFKEDEIIATFSQSS